MKKFAFFLLVFLLLVLSAESGTAAKVRIVVNKANIRATPSANGAVIHSAWRGEIFPVLEKKDKWYKIQLPVQGGADPAAGYVSQAVVAEVDGQGQGAAGGTAAGAEARADRARPRRDYPAPDQGGTGLSPDRLAMIDLEKKVRTESLAFHSLVKKMKPEKTTGAGRKSVEMVKVNRGNCPVYESADGSSRVIYNARINDEFEVLDRNDDLFRVLLADGRKGWVAENRVQQFAREKKETVVKFQGVPRSEIRDFIDVAAAIFSRIAAHKALADGIIEKRGITAAGRGSEEREIVAAHARIGEFFRSAQYFYSQFIEGNGILFAPDVDFLSRLSLWGELLLGTSDYKAKWAAAVEDSKGGTHSFGLGGNLALNKSSQLSFSFANKKDIIQTPYTSTVIQADYALNPQDKFALRAGVNFNDYGDKFNPLNDFNQMNVTAGADFTLSPRTDFHFNYSFLRNNSSQDASNSYSHHSILVAANLNMNPLARLSFQVQSNLESSDSGFHKFNRFEPAVRYEKRRENSRMQVGLAYEMLSYGDLELKSYNRLDLRIGSDRRRGNFSASGDLSFLYKSFSGNSQASYMQFKGRYSSSSSGRLNKLFSATLFTNLYSDNSAGNYSDLRIDLGGTSAAFFNDTSVYFRLWHSPVQGTTNKFYKPHVIDLYEKLGFNFAGFRIGPVIGVHLLVSAEEGVEFLKRDGNVIRFGGVAEGRFRLPARGSLSVSAAYEYGFVYSEEISVNTNTGQLTIGEVEQRHPTTFQVNSTLSIPVAAGFEFVGQVNYYKIASDMDAKLSIDPVLQNSRFSLLLGLRYKYN